MVNDCERLTEEAPPSACPSAAELHAAGRSSGDDIRSIADEADEDMELDEDEDLDEEDLDEEDEEEEDLEDEESEP